MQATVQCPTIRPELAYGATGQAVRDLQTAINYRLMNLPMPAARRPIAVDGQFGQVTESAVKYLQCVSYLAIDGIVGAQTWGYLCEGAASLTLLSTTTNSPFALVKRVQDVLKTDRYYTGVVDGIYGAKTEAAVRLYQRDSHLPITGKVDMATWTQLIARRMRGGSCNTL